MSTIASLSLVLGALLGLGLWILASAVPRVGSASLAQRVAPFVADISPEAFDWSTRIPENPAGILAKVLAAGVLGGFPLKVGLRGNSEDTVRRLRQAGSRLTLEAFRARQFLWALGGGAGGILVDVMVSAGGTSTLAGLIIVPVIGAASGYFAAEYFLRRSVVLRAARIASELPTVFEFISLCLAAGESITDSLRRVARIGSGDFASELSLVMRQVDTGVALASALRELSVRVELPAVTRGIEQILGAMDRGSPLAAVLQAQAQDSREDSKRELLESAGKKEVVMLVPLVFLILPITILFAVFPGLATIQSGFAF